MRLLLHRSQHRTVFRQLRYTLDVTLVTSQEERRVIKAHRLYEQSAYIVPEALEFDRRATAACERERSLSPLRTKDSGAIIKADIAALYFWLRARTAFHVTVADMCNSIVITCTNMPQLIACENEITATFDELKVTVDNALTFETGREQILAPDAEADPDITPPAAWRPNYRR